MLEDNYSYYVYSMANMEEGFFVDVADYDKIEAFRNNFGY